MIYVGSGASKARVGINMIVGNEGNLYLLKINSFFEAVSIFLKAELM